MLEPTEPEGPPPYHPSTVKQWAKRVISFSSQYNSSGWSANMALGEPRVYPQHGDLHGAWATSDIDSNQFIELEYEVCVTPTAIKIYETFHPGAVKAIRCRDSNGRWETLWETSQIKCLNASRIFSPPLKETRTRTSQIRIEMDCTLAGTWCEIDAVQLIGIRDGAVAPVDDTKLIEDLKSLVNQKHFSDVELRIHGHPVYAHKGLLAARSSYFLEMFSKDKSAIYDLHLPELTQEDFLVVLNFIYTNRIPHDCKFPSLISLCKASSILELPGLKTAAMYKLLENLKCENVVEVFHLVRDHKNLEDLKSICTKYMADHLKSMSRISAFQTLQQSDIISVVQEATAKLDMDN